LIGLPALIEEHSDIATGFLSGFLHGHMPDARVRDKFQ
jgi:hypothetical protein